jgi:putative spermidine/putrescine transport system permease protein
VKRGGGGTLLGVNAVVAAFLLLPLGIVLAESFTRGSFLTFPPQGLGLRWYRHVLGHEDWQRSLETTLIVAAIVTPLAIALGTAAALALDRGRFAGRSALYTLTISPIIVPHVVMGLALLRVLSLLRLTDTLAGFVLAHLTVTVPYVVITVTASLRSIDASVEDSAMSLGANPWRTFRHVTLPLIRPGLIGGAIFAFLVSFDEFIMTYFITSLKVTLPIMIFSTLRYQVDPSIAAVSGLMLMVSAALVVVYLLVGRRA